MRGVLIQLGQGAVQPAHQLEALTVPLKGPSTVVVGLDLIHDQLGEELRDPVIQGRFKRELQDHLEQQLHGACQIDVFKQTTDNGATHTLVRIPSL